MEQKSPAREPHRRHLPPEPLNMKWANDYPRLTRTGVQKYLVEEIDPKGRSAVARQQDDHGDRPAHRHHGLDRRPLHGGDQGAR